MLELIAQICQILRCATQDNVLFVLNSVPINPVIFVANSKPVEAPISLIKHDQEMACTATLLTQAEASPC